MPSSTNYGFNQTEDIRSHSATLFNERFSILVYLLDMKSIELHKYPENPDMIRTVFSLNKQIYKNIRMLISHDPVKRNVLGLETTHAGVYVPDVVEGIIDRMIEFCEENGYTRKKCRIISKELDNFEIMWRGILHSYQYFVRSDFKQKPDVVPASEKYKTMANESTIEQLRQVIGKNHKLDDEVFSDPKRAEKQLEEFKHNEHDDDSGEVFEDDAEGLPAE